MPRTIVYESPETQSQYLTKAEGKKLSPPEASRLLRESRELAFSGGTPPDGSHKPADKELAVEDDYLAKLVKYIPAETIALATLGFATFAAAKPSDQLVWILVAVFALLNILYLFSTALMASKSALRPRGYFYPISALAFVLWAMAIIEPVRLSAQHWLGVTQGEEWQSFILMLAAFVIPAMDTIGGWLYFNIWPPQGSEDPGPVEAPQPLTGERN